MRDHQTSLDAIGRSRAALDRERRLLPDRGDGRDVDPAGRPARPGAGLLRRHEPSSARRRRSLIAREKAREAIESVHTARDTRVITWAQIRNVDAPGLRLPGRAPPASAAARFTQRRSRACWRPAPTASSTPTTTRGSSRRRPGPTTSSAPPTTSPLVGFTPRDRHLRHQRQHRPAPDRRDHPLQRHQRRRQPAPRPTRSTTYISSFS